MTDTNTDTNCNENTNKKIVKSRAWFITIFEDELQHPENAIYDISCEDTTKDGKFHYHQVLNYKNAVSFNSIKKLYPTAHIEKPRSIFDSISYIKNNKNGRKKNIIELGKAPVNTRFTVGDLKKIKNDDDLDWRVKNTWKKIRDEEDEKEAFFNMLDEIKDRKLKGPEVIYLYGPPGNGKTFSAWDIALNKYKKEEIGKISIVNNFCKLLNDNAKCFIIPEFRPSQMHAAEFLQLIDKYGHDCNVKGGFKFIRPEMIIICSVLSPYNIYNNENNKQFLRRITKLYKLDKNHNMKEIEIKLNNDEEYNNEEYIRDEDVM